MDYTITDSASSRISIGCDLSNALFSISGSSAAATPCSCLSDLATPSLSSVTCSPGSGWSPMDAFEFQVCHRWTLNFGPEEGAIFNDTFQEMRSSGSAYLTGYSYQTLQDMHDQGMIRWGEAEINAQKLRGLTLPLDPGFDLSGSFKGPPIFVRQPDDGGGIVIMNGNHRVAKVLSCGAPLSASIYVLELASPEASKRLLGIAPSMGYASPRMPANFNYSFNS